MDINYYKKYEPFFGEYRIVGELGEGSYGKVFKIERRDITGTYYSALKAMSIPKNDGEIDALILQRRDPATHYQGIAAKVMQEVEHMSKLSGNSNIVSYQNHKYIPHDNGIGCDILIQMELLTSLYKYLQGRRFGEADVIKIGIDICKGLDLCHRFNIIHRDVKPDNIFVSDTGDYKIGDFGVAKISDATASGTKAGTPNYMAPEIYHGKEYGKSADVYSLGVTLYELLNGYRQPFEREESDDPFEREKAAGIRLEGAALPKPKYGSEGLKAIVLKACEFDPRNRYHSAQEMMRDLEMLRMGKVPQPAVKHRVEPDLVVKPPVTPVQPNPPTQTTKPNKPGGSLKTILIAAIAGLVVIAGAAAFFLIGPGLSEPDNSPGYVASDDWDDEDSLGEDVSETKPDFLPKNASEAFHGHYYAIYDIRDGKKRIETFDMAEAFCESKGGHLAVINDQEENDFIYSYITSRKNRDNGKPIACAFFGYTDQANEGDWEWVYGESDYTNWDPKTEQPNNGKFNQEEYRDEDYAQFSKSARDGTWNDARFTSNSYKFICEWE